MRKDQLKRIEFLMKSNLQTSLQLIAGCQSSSFLFQISIRSLVIDSLMTLLHFLFTVIN